MLNFIIFSKDRALQLDSLLRSVRDQFKVPFERIYILYQASNSSFDAAYQKLIQKSIVSPIDWIREANFRTDLMKTVDALPSASFIMFMVDDDILFRKFDDVSILQRFSSRHLFVSLRADRSYVADSWPRFKQTEPLLEWAWRTFKVARKKITWHYPFSVDGNIFHAADIQRMLREIEFKAPNSFEGNMHAHKSALWLWRRSLALAPSSAVLFNNPLNRVQQEGSTWNAGLSVEEMNDKYLDGWVIDNQVLYCSRPNAVHFHVDLSVVREY